MDDQQRVSLDLIRKVAQGDRDAFAALYDQHAAALYSVARRTTTSPETASELTQDTFLAIWRSAESYDPARSKVFSWMVMILRRKAIDRHRFDARRLPGPGTVNTERQREANTEKTPADEAEDRDRLDSLSKLLSDLPDDQRIALELAFFEGFTHQEIATQQSEPLGTIKSRIRLALNRLRDQVDDLPAL